MGRGAWQAPAHGITWELDTVEWLSTQSRNELCFKGNFKHEGKDSPQVIQVASEERET